MPTFPISSARDLGLGQTGGGSQAPAVVQGVGLVIDQDDAPSGAVWLYPYSAGNPASLTGQVPSGLIFGMGAYEGNIYAVKADGTVSLVISDGALSPDAPILFPDAVPAEFGTDADDNLQFDGTNFVWTHTAGNLLIDNTAATGATYLDLGTDTSATSFAVRNNSGVAKLSINGAGACATAMSTVDLDCTGALQINSSAGAIGIGNDAVAQAINIGTGAAARTITVGNSTTTTALVLNAGSGGVSVGGPFKSPVTVSQSVDTGNTITLPTSGFNKLIACSTAADKTGVILTAGTIDGQTICLINTTAANSITMAAAGTSNVADGASCVIPALRAMIFTWDATSSRWYRQGA